MIHGKAWMALLYRAVAFLVASMFIYMASMVILMRVNTKRGPMLTQISDYYKHRGGGTLQKFNEFNPGLKYDVVIIGSSHAYRGYDPEIFTQRGYSVFNLGTSAQTPKGTYWLVREYLNESNTSVLILDLYENILMSNGLESAADLALNQPSTLAAAGITLGLFDLRGLNMLVQRLVYPAATQYPTDPNYRGLGFCPRMDSVKITASPGPLTKARSRPSLAPAQLDAVLAIQALCEERGIRLILSSHYGLKERASLHAAMSDFIEEHLVSKGIPYLDFFDADGVDTLNWFADRTHLNYAGAQVFTTALVDSLELNGYLTRPKHVQ